MKGVLAVYLAGQLIAIQGPYPTYEDCVKANIAATHPACQGKDRQCVCEIRMDPRIPTVEA